MQSRVKQKSEGPCEKEMSVPVVPISLPSAVGALQAVRMLASLLRAHNPIHGWVGCLPLFLHR